MKKARRMVGFFLCGYDTGGKLFENALFPTWGDKRLLLNKKAHLFVRKNVP